MAQRRMLSRRLSQSKRVNHLSLKAQIVWTWIIPWLDDYGCYDADAEDIKTEVFPKNTNITVKDISNALLEEEEIGLIKVFNVNGKIYQKYDNFETFQTLKTDRPKKSDIPGYYEGMELNGNQGNPAESSGSPEVKLSKVKLSKVKLTRAREEPIKLSYGEFVTLTDNQHKELIKRFGTKKTDKILDKLNNAKGSKGYEYISDYHAIFSWVLKEVEKEETNQTEGTRMACKKCGDNGQYAGIDESGLCTNCRIK